MTGAFSSSISECRGMLLYQNISSALGISQFYPVMEMVFVDLLIKQLNGPRSTNIIMLNRIMIASCSSSL